MCLATKKQRDVEYEVERQVESHAVSGGLIALGSASLSGLVKTMVNERCKAASDA